MAEHAHHEHEPRRSGGLRRWVFWGFLLVAGYFLLTEHRAHVVPYLPFLLLLACPLMHMFHGHGGHGHGDEDEERRSGRTEADKPDSGKKHAGGCH